jgi:hypothetical protein
MKIKKFTVAGCFLLSGLAVASAQVKLSFNPAKGAKYEYAMQIAQTVEQNAMGQKIPMETEMDITYLMEIRDKTPQETQAQFTYRDISCMISSPVMKMGYDSKNPVENPSEMDRVLGMMFGTLIGKPFTINVAPDGSVKSVSGMDAIAGNMTQAIASGGQTAAQVGASMKQQFSDDAMKNMFEQSLKIYPAGAVKPGDSWNVESTVTLSGMNTAINTKYTLKEVRKNEAAIAMEATVNMQPGAGMEGNFSGTQTGTMLVNVKTGMPVSSELSQNIKGSLKTQGIDISMDMNTKTTLSTKEVK